MATNTNGNRNNLPALSEDTIRSMVAVQNRQLEVRLEELKRESAELSHNQTIAKQSIEAQLADRTDERAEVTKRQKNHHQFILIAIVLIIGFSCFALYMGQSAIVLDIVKVTLGFAGGAGFQAYRQSQKSNKED